MSLNAACSSAANSSSVGTAGTKELEMIVAGELVVKLTNRDLREDALLELCKRKEIFPDLGPLIWNTAGTIAALLQEILSIYPDLSRSQTLTLARSTRVCNAVALLQCVALHPDTRMPFLRANIPLYLYPFLNNMNTSTPFEYLRLASLSLIGALVKDDDTEIIRFLLDNEIFPLCLGRMENGGGELSKEVAIYIVQKILSTDVGLDYVCVNAERLLFFIRVLGSVVGELVNERPSLKILKRIIGCYLRLSDNPMACEALRVDGLPDVLKDDTFNGCLREDPSTRKYLLELLYRVLGLPVPLQNWDMTQVRSYAR
ncbi:OLC1v1035311C1 [Oldenlandia corymbosa var. corymbosa]|uniref:OLC1v1035311C1 n=1 Tax=Oldenlandia corymbosa var. corymbosa TaxID=529605 RepID=A0AAV1CT70_OLDCO|nr:OLC1v1035311C1 [Oldenlandia corymbosa var. corymbosa]